MIAEQEVVPVQQETRAEAQQRQHDDGPQEERLQRPGQMERADVEVDGELAHIRRHVPLELPGTRGEPVDHHGGDADGQHQGQQILVERKFEEIEGQRMSEGRVAPGGRRVGEPAPAEIADGDPRVHGCRTDDQGQRKQHRRGNARVEAMPAEAGAGEPECSCMGDPEHQKGNDGGEHRRR